MRVWIALLLLAPVLAGCVDDGPDERAAKRGVITITKTATHEWTSVTDAPPVISGSDIGPGPAATPETTASTTTSSTSTHDGKSGNVGPLAAKCIQADAKNSGSILLWKSAADFVPTYRIPALVNTGTALIAAAEYRLEGPADQGHVEIVSRVSHDGGKSWTKSQIITANEENVAGNPTLIFDAKRQRAALLTTWSLAVDNAEAIRDGRGIGARTVWIQYANATGLGWTEPKEITAQVKDPIWRAYGTGPGSGIQLREGEYAGRIIVPAWHSDGNRTGYGAYGMHLLLSDDGGSNWRIGARAHGDEHINPNEASIVEVNGAILIVARDQHGTSSGHRISTWSLDGGETFSENYRLEEGIVSPMVHGTLVSCVAKEETLVLWAGPSHPSKRSDLCLRTLQDGRWHPGALVKTGPAGYSDAAHIGGGLYGLMWETGTEKPHETIRFQLRSWADARLGTCSPTT